MKKLSLMLLMLGFIASCDNGGGPSPEENPVSPVITKGASVCLDYKSGQIPVGTYAKRTATGEKALLDSKGCFSFPAAEVAARASGSDSIQFYNDSALFALSIPYANHGEVIQVVPTVISYKGCPNSVIDSIFLVAFDTEHMLSRRVKMKKATYRDTSEYSRTVWSLEGGNNFKVHFDVFDKNDRWPSHVIESEPGSTMSLVYRTSDKAESFVPYVPDTLIFSQYLEGDEKNLYWYSRNVGGSWYSRSYAQAYRTDTTKSLYGSVMSTIDGVAAMSLTADTSLFRVSDTVLPSHTVRVQVRDAAGYGVEKVMTIIHIRDFAVSIDTTPPIWPRQRILTYSKSYTPSYCKFRYFENGVTSDTLYASRLCVEGDSSGRAGDSVLVSKRVGDYSPSTLRISYH